MIRIGKWLHELYSFGRDFLMRAGPTTADMEQAKAELIGRALKGGVPLDIAPGDDYPTIFAGLHEAQAAKYLDLLNSSDPNYPQLLSGTMKSQFVGLRSRFGSLAVMPSSEAEALSMIWEAHQNDAVCAVEQMEVLTVVLRAMKFSIFAFVILLGLQATFASFLGCVPLFDPLKGTLQARSIQAASIIATNLNNFFFSIYFLGALTATMGALFGVYLDLPQEGSPPHWRLVRRYSRITRCWAGTAVGLLTASLAPVLGVTAQGQEGGARLFAAAFVFGFSQEMFLKKLQGLTGGDGKS